MKYSLRLISIGGFLFFLMALLMGLQVWSQYNNVQVSVQVGDEPAVPALLLSIDPATEPVLVNLNGSRTINFEVNPNITNNPISWTATVSSGGGSVGPLSGTINTTQTTTAYFDFLSPAVAGPSVVTLRVFDSQDTTIPVITRTIAIYSF